MFSSYSFMCVVSLLNHNFFTVYDIDTGIGNLVYAAAEEVVDGLLSFGGVDGLDS